MLSEWQSTAFSFTFVPLQNLLPLTFLGSARHLELIHVITPSLFSCCITVSMTNDKPFFLFAHFCHQAKRKKIWNLRHKAVCSHSHCSNSQTYASKWVRTVPTYLSFPFTWQSDSEEGGKFSSSLYSAISRVLGEFPAQKMTALQRDDKKKHLSSKIREYYRTTLRISPYRLPWTQSTLKFLQLKSHSPVINFRSFHWALHILESHCTVLLPWINNIL